jgi:hypothetical protein
LIHILRTDSVKVNFAAFHSTYEVDTPVCPANELDAFFAEKEDEKKHLKKPK